MHPLSVHHLRTTAHSLSAVSVSPKAPASTFSAVLSRAKQPAQAARLSSSNAVGIPTGVVRAIDAAQARLDKLVRVAQSGRSFSAAELIGLQAQAFAATQVIEFSTRVAEKSTSGIKQLLQAQV